MTKAQRAEVRVWRKLRSMARTYAGDARVLGGGVEAAAWDHACEWLTYMIRATEDSLPTYQQCRLVELD